MTATINWTQMTTLAQGTDAEWQRAFEILYLSGELRARAKAAYQDFPQLHSALDWEDLFMDALLRLLKILREDGRVLDNGRGFFYSVCRNICREIGRKNKEVPTESSLTKADPFDVLVDYIQFAEEPDLRKRLDYCLAKLQPAGRMLLHLSYLEEPPVDDPKKLAAALNGLKKPGEKPVQPSSIPTLIARWKSRFFALLTTDKSLYQLFKS